MPNRIIRDAILTSEAVCRLGWPEEVFYRRLMSIVDDYGRCEANPQLLRSRCYPLQTDLVRVADITRWMAACQKTGVILHYEVEGKQYLQIEKFGQQQRSASKCPSPATTAINCQQPLADEHLGVFVVEDVDVNPPTPRAGGGDGGFLDFWEAWPKCERKQDKAKCLEVWKRQRLQAIAEQIVADVRLKRGTQKWRDGFVEAPLVYLRGKRWEDGVTPEVPPSEAAANEAVERSQAYLREQAAHKAVPPPAEVLAKLRSVVRVVS